MSPIGSEKQYDASKFKELVLYISYKNRDNQRFGSTLLNKMLYYCDFEWFANTGRSITKDVYIRREWGPTPKHLVEVREELELTGELQMKPVQYFSKEQKRPYVNRQPELIHLNEQEIIFVDRIIERMSTLNATQVSELTHRELSWQLFHDGEEVPYETVFVRSINPIPIDTMEWAQEEVNKRTADR